MKTQITKILESVCFVFDISQQDLKGKSRKRQIVDARKMFAGITLKMVDKITLSELGALIGRDHTMVIFYRNKHEDLISTSDAGYLDKYRDTMHHIVGSVIPEEFDKMSIEDIQLEIQRLQNKMDLLKLAKRRFI